MFENIIGTGGGGVIEVVRFQGYWLQSLTVSLLFVKTYIFFLVITHIISALLFFLIIIQGHIV